MYLLLDRIFLPYLPLQHLQSKFHFDKLLIVKLNGYGDYVFKNVPVVVTMFTLDMPTEIDYIAVDLSDMGALAEATKGATDTANIKGTVAYVPVQSQVTVTVQPIYSRTDVQGFSLSDFVNGEYVTQEKGFI